jgi:hypothetical protein
LCLIIWPAIFADSAKGNRISVFLDFSYLFDRFGCGHWLTRIARWGISLQQTRQKEVEGRDAFRSVNARTTRYQ